MRTLAILTIGLFALAACGSSSPQPAPNVLPEGPPEVSEPSEPQQRVYIGQVSTRLYHVETCRELDGVADEDQVLFDNPGEALDRDWHPCEECEPEKDI